MFLPFKKKLLLLAGILLFAVPSSAYAVFDFGGWVLNFPGTHEGKIFLTSSPSFPPKGYNTFWDSGQGVCDNGVEEVDQKQAAGVPQPPILLQISGFYTFSRGPARHPGQQILGKYIPVMVCIMTYVFWVPCGYTLCPVIVPLPFFFAPLIIFNGSSI